MRFSALPLLLAVFVSQVPVGHSAELPKEIRLLLPYPDGKADSVLAASDPLVFVGRKDLTALESAVETALPKPPKPPVVGTVSAVSIRGAVGDEAGTLTAKYVIDLLADTLVYIPLVDQATPVLSVTHGSVPLVLTSGGANCVPHVGPHGSGSGFWGSLLRGPGRFELEATLLIPVSRSGDRHSLQLNLPPVGTSSLLLTLPPGDWQAESITSHASIRETSEGSVLALNPGRGGQIHLSWSPTVRKVPRAPEQAKAARIEAKSENLLTLGEAAVKGVVDVELRIWAGQAQLLKFAVPKGLEIMQVTGPNIDTWEEDDGEISVYLAGPVQGTEHIVFDYLITLPGPSGVVSVPTFVVGGAHRQNAFWAVVATTNIEVELETGESIEVLQPRELPQTLRQRAPGRVLLAFRGDPGASNAVLRVSRHADVPVLVAAIDRASLSTVLYESGEQVTTCTYEVRNTTKQFLEMMLPSAAHLWHVRVDGQPVRPGVVNGRVLLPLASSVGRIQEKSFPVELTYIVVGRPPGLAGRIGIEGPAPDLPCSRVQWTLHYPDRMNPVRWGGNLEIDVRPSISRGAEREELKPEGEPRMRIRGGRAGAEYDQRAPTSLMEQDEILGDAEEEIAAAKQRLDLTKSGQMQTSEDYYRQMVPQQARLPRRLVGKPSVAVEAPLLGHRATFSQILQQDESPSINCWYVRKGMRWEYGAIVLLFILLAILVTIRHRTVSALLILLCLVAMASASENPVPREVVKLIPEGELSSFFIRGGREELSFVPYSKISNLLETLRTARRFFEAPSMAYLDNVTITLDIQESVAAARGSATLVSMGQGWQQMEFLSAPAHPVQVLLDKNPAPLWCSGQSTRLLVDPGLPRELDMEYTVPVAGQGNSRTVVLPFPPASGVDLTVRFPAGTSGLQVAGRRVELSEDDEHLTASLALPGTRSTSFSWRHVPPELALPSAVRPSEEDLAPGRVLAEGATLFSVDVGAVVGHSHLLFDIVQGYCDSLVFEVPATVEVLEVSSASLDDWLLRADGEQRSLLVYLRPKSQGRHVIDMVFEIPLDDSLTAATLAEPAVVNTVRFRGLAGVQVLSSLRVTAVDQVGASRTDPRDLPPEVWARAANPILLAYKFVEPDYSALLRLEQQDDVPLLSASVDRENLLSVVSPTGRAVHRAEFRLRNSGEQFLRISLAENARIWTYLVNGKTFAPSRSDDGSYRLPVPASPELEGLLQPIMLELVWGEEFSISPIGGKLNLVGPGLDIPCSVVQWELYLPKKRKWLPPRGNLKRNLFLPETGRVVGDKKSAEKAFDMLRQLSEEGIPSEVGGEGWETGAMPVQVDIPMEGARVTMGRAMLLGESPHVNLWFAPSFPKIPVVAVSMLVVTLLWRFMREFHMVGFLFRAIVTAILVVTCDPLAILGAPIGLLWRGLRPRKESPASYDTV